jgi:hypothetical protein
LNQERELKMYMRAIATLQLDNAVVTTTAAGTEVDLQKHFVNPGKREMKAVLGVLETVSSDSGSIAYKLQHSNTTVDSDFSDISGGAFSTLQDSDTNTVQELHFFTNRRYIRGYRTLVGGADWATVCTVYAIKRDA